MADPRSAMSDVADPARGRRRTLRRGTEYRVRGTGSISREGVAPSPPASDAGVHLLHHRDAGPDPLPGYGVRFLVRDPGLAPGLCLLPKQVGRCLPMSLEFSAAERSRTSMPFGAWPSTRCVYRIHHSRESLVPSEGIAPPSSRCERDILLLEEPGGILEAGLRVARSLRAYEAREAAAPSLPQNDKVDPVGFEPTNSAF